MLGYLCHIYSDHTFSQKQLGSHTWVLSGSVCYFLLPHTPMQHPRVLLPRRSENTKGGPYPNRHPYIIIFLYTPERVQPTTLWPELYPKGYKINLYLIAYKRKHVKHSHRQAYHQSRQQHSRKNNKEQRKDHLSFFHVWLDLKGWSSGNSDKRAFLSPPFFSHLIPFLAGRRLSTFATRK